LSYFTSDKAPFQFAGAPFAIATIVALIALMALFILRPAAKNTAMT